MKLSYVLAVLLTGSVSFASTVFEPLELNKNEVVFTTSARNISVIDPTPITNASGSTFPGGRGANQLIIYTPNFGDRTNTNEYGTEAIVQDNIVTMISGANSFIPKDGIVISGHGNAKTWINKNIGVGTKVYIDKDNNSINVFTTSDSYMYEAQDKISITLDMMNFYKDKVNNYSWKESDEHISDAQKYLKKAKKELDNQEQLKQYTQMAIDEANLALSTVLPSIPTELKGVWIRPTETTETQIIATLDNMKKTGIDSIFIEKFFHGKTIFPSKTMKEYGFTVQNEKFTTIDPLEIWIREAHKRDMKVHIWFQSFYVGNTPPYKEPQSILANYPQWGNKTLNDYQTATPTCSKSEHNGYFLDPANPKVQDFLINLITEIMTEYKPDGINLDYIRYPQAVSKNEAGAWGYTQYARQDFKDIYGTDPIELRTNDKLWNKWEEYRRENITNFVRKIGTLGHENGVYTSAVIFPDIETALSTKQQDWRTWSKRNYIDGFTPLFLTYDSDMVASMMKNINKLKSPTTEVFAGIFVTFMGGSNEDLIKQIHETRKLNADGVILFDYAHTTAKYSNMLANSAFKQTSAKCKTKEKKKKKFLWFKKN